MHESIQNPLILMHFKQKIPYFNAICFLFRIFASVKTDYNYETEENSSQ